ncbi:acyltransferase family protein [Carboxylicivirga linearis]|uniref:Acyltransferase n=1 Tax=Carboxylicivirga linearis TaxID=1628157 RepID=A0ABS5K1J5_9BACT|nr:acyltransferase [Carboxylicivirga linearis]MBS2100975.1 acyltransferase [Carboxylicivirga linearis]
MNLSNTSQLGFSDTKKHYKILDGLRGVAAIIVVAFHILETFTGGDHSKQIINHGYLAVDFFFVLSGFVIGYAYDDRWQKMTLGGFFKRRLIRLHPMIIIGMIIGAVTFYFQDSSFFPVISETPVWKMLLVMVIGFTLIPVGHSMDIRGWTEMHPLNGPAWSLFFEYVGNILYALFIRKLSNKILALLVFIAGAALIHLAVTSPHGDVIGGWSIDATQLRIGFTRLLYPFLAGLLLSRIVKPGQYKNAFFWSSLILVVVFSIPRVGNPEQVWQNGLYDSLSIIFVFPLVVYIGASGETKGKMASKISRFLGDISYPLYIIHYPFIYMYMAWIAKNQEFIDTAPLGKTTMILISITVLLVTVTLAYALFKLYDVPVRKWLTNKLMKK